MNYQIKGENIFLRLDPGDKLIECLISLSCEIGLNNAAIISGVGMVNNPKLGFFEIENDDYTVTVLEGIFDLNSISGNITKMDDKIIPHVHLVFNDKNFRCYGGHLIETEVHITMEIFISLNSLIIERKKVVGCPATRITIV